MNKNLEEVECWNSLCTGISLHCRNNLRVSESSQESNISVSCAIALQVRRFSIAVHLRTQTL
ncbi:hypothetical protein G7B40_038445 [Aetokthonos hydrillicola Thurmond2011]|uniref:Uncharacterized protein n=1 Tax=Aetokthonos hydrillicola Thurmond2011 TaxID=2712845 RepID=A0AAP5IH24_9CYAN|nr:hypothetical protein [Aetokthonos hydrillicola]MBO3464097.1 hypothetical protein [Aetokthonos hydrillicola CCALA 1050]MDR9900387.1 hypothetical protein [Aetokthonos hydrillicola Thurmond2011]